MSLTPTLRVGTPSSTLYISLLVRTKSGGEREIESLMRVTLIPVAGKHRGEEFVLDRFPCAIGRSPDCRLILCNPRVSRSHCTIDVRDQRVVLRDNASSNGTFVNERKIEGEIALADSDRLAVGPVEFWVHIVPDSTDELAIDLETLLSDL